MPPIYQADPSSATENEATYQQNANSGDGIVDNSGSPGESEDSLLSVMRSVTAQSEDAKPAGEGVDPPSNDSEVGQLDEEEADSAKDDDFSDVPFNQHPRFRKLVFQKNKAREQLAELEPDAQQYRQIQSFMDRASLTPEEVAEGLVMMAEMKSGDPVKAYEALSKKMESLALAAGKTLPPELEDRVSQGYVDRETAVSMHQQQLALARQASEAQRNLSRRTADDTAAQTRAVATAVQGWETKTKSTDPDYSVKAELVRDRLRANFAASGMPKTPEEAVKLATAAYEDVTKTLNRVKGPKQEIRTVSGGKVNGSAAPEPQSLREAMFRSISGG